MIAAREFDATVARAEEFVERHGSRLDRARVAFRLRREVPDEGLLARFSGGQLADGAWAACWSRPYGSLEGTCHALARLGGLGPGDGLREMRLEGARFLLANQQADGSWDEVTPGPRPPWLADTLECRVYLTALCGSTLVGVNGAAVRRAAEVLRRRLRTDGSLAGPIAAQWLTARVLATVGEDDLALAALDPVVDVIDELDPAWLAWAALAMPHSNAAGRARRLLARRQRGDGGWQTDLGSAVEGEVAVMAIETLTS